MPTNRHSRWPRPPDTLNPRQAAFLLEIQTGTLARQARLGQLKVIKLGKLNRYPADEIRRLVIERKTRAVAEKFLPLLDKMVEDNNAAIEKEANDGRRKD